MLRQVNLLWKVAAVLGMLLALSLTGTPVAAEEDVEEDKWDLTFDGHEMWSTDLDSALALAAQQSKPLLIDIYSRL